MHHPSSLYFGCLQHPRQLWSCPLYFWSYAPSFFLIFWLFATSTSVVVLSFIFLVVCTILLPYILIVCNIHVSCGLVLYIFGFSPSLEDETIPGLGSNKMSRITLNLKCSHCTGLLQML